MARAKTVLESVPSAPPVRAPRKQSRRPSRPAQPRQVYERRYVQTVRTIDLWSVLKMSICFYLCALIVILVAGMMLWWVAALTGVIGNIEKFLGDLVNNTEFRFLSWHVLRACTLFGLVIVCVMTVLTVLAATFYNLFSELVGGVEVTVVEQEQIGT